MSSSNAATRTDLVRQQALVVMRPLVTWLVRSGVGYADFASALKPLFLEQARQELLRHGERVNDSALSLRSGLHRKDVKSLAHPVAAEGDAERAAAGRPTPAQQLVTRWLTQDWPHTLPLMGEGQSFAQLAAQVTRDLHHRALLDELLRLGVVSLADGQVSLRREAYVPDACSSEAARLLAESVSDHLAAAVHNVSGAGPRRYLDQSVFADGLTPESVQALEQLANQLWAHVLQTVVAAAQPLCEQDEPLGGDQRIRLGLYCYGTAMEPEPAAKAGETDHE
ncbi:MAG: hypothetical protein RLZZ352_2892 [Pseudomonadota bacterium]|jgi:hypothetical protein